MKKLQPLSGGDETCQENGICPTVYEPDEGMVPVQGFKLTDHGLDLPPGEDIVNVPLEVFLDAAGKLKGQQ